MPGEDRESESGEGGSRQQPPAVTDELRPNRDQRLRDREAVEIHTIRGIATPAANPIWPRTEFGCANEDEAAAQKSSRL
jgi:hypothetical protein